MKYADLHVHTTASDGTVSPSEVVHLAAEAGLAAIAITDHDTVAGIEEAKIAGSRLEVDIISGIEISTDYLGNDVHMLGYFIDPESPELEPVLNWAVNEKDIRNRKIVEALKEAGFSIDLSEIEAKNPGAVIGRPHIAAEMAAKGYVSSVSECFDRYVGEGRPFYVTRQRIDFAEAIAFIIRSGGKAVLAHPLQYKFSPKDTEKMVALAKTHGCVGLEVYYTDYSESDISFLLNLAEKYGLIPTGGSDFHGENKPDIAIGQAKVPYDTVELISPNP